MTALQQTPAPTARPCAAPTDLLPSGQVIGGRVRSRTPAGAVDVVDPRSGEALTQVPDGSVEGVATTRCSQRVN